VLEISNLVAGYGLKNALQGVSLSVTAGEIVTLIGSNGAGKSTTLRAVSGLIRSRSGSIVFDGKNIFNATPHQIVDAGLVHVPEGRRLFGEMTVRENLLLGGYSRPKSEAVSHIEEIFASFPRLRERAGQLAGSMSGGEQQMLAIGRGLMAKPSLLMLDEPSLGLAPKVVSQIGEMVLTIRKAGVTVLLVEQNARMALRISDRAYVLKLGGVVQSGASSSLLDDVQIQKAYLGL
jgi:branched-chain amino acid transport system ATP-binding protein